MNFTESQFQTILCHTMFSYWTSVEIKNGLNINGRELIPLAREYAAKEDEVNDWFSGWGRGIDLLLIDRTGKISLVEMKKECTSRAALLRQASQAYEGAYYLSKVKPERMLSMFEESFRVLFGAVNGRGESIFDHPKNQIFEVHKRFFKLAQPLVLDKFKDLMPTELILSLNPGSSFPDGSASIKNMSAEDILRELSSLGGNDNNESYQRLKEICNSNISIPITLLEFAFSLQPNVYS